VEGIDIDIAKPTTRCSGKEIGDEARPWARFWFGYTPRYCERRGIIATRSAVMMYAMPKEGRFKFL
jgi:hypothetical protein